MSIDWSKANDRAVAALIAKKNNIHYPCFEFVSGYHRTGCMIRATSADDGRPLSALEDVWEIVERPATWSGQGLPPVGTVCELQQEMKRIFSYDPETGCLRWKENQQKRFIGRVAGFITHHGYRRVNVGKTKLHAHQIIWLMHYGELPDCEIDHINGMRDDNRLENLRLANQQQNQQNSNVRIDNVLGVKGVRLRPSGNYQARVKLSDGSRAVKTFRTLTEAVSWLSMQREISHGEYANTPEQIAADERRKSILHLANILIDSRGQCNEYSQAEAIFDAGYRRQEEGK
ncbi:TPA: HNH endonuclease [Pseudomonas aeruginosa]|nr:HNH endonuclease [Pseudomonas aeruginosa]